MSSLIDPTKPPAGIALTSEVRANFAAAKGEIEALQAGTGLVDGSVTDAKLGNRTIDPALAGGASTGTLTQLLGWISKISKAISGETNWFDTPGTTLKSHVANISNPHSVTGAQLGLGTMATQAASAVAITGGTISGLTDRPCFSAITAGAQAGIASATPTKVLFGTELFDTNNNFASSRFTPTVAGKYQLNASCLFVAGVDQSQMYLSIYKNGTALHSGPIINQSGTGTCGCPVSAVVDANGTTDYFEIYVVHSTGSNQTLDSGAAYTWFNGARGG